MAEEAIGMTEPEAGLILTAVISLADDNPSDEEVIVLRKFYKSETVDSLEKKINEAGLKYPENLMELEIEALNVLADAESAFIKRTLAVCLRVAEADGTVDQDEFNLLNKYCDRFDLTVYELEQYSKKKLKELDETRGYTDTEDLSESEIPLNIELSQGEAGIALATWLAFSDDNPSDEEMSVIREYFTETDVEGLVNKIESFNAVFPDAVPRLEESVKKAFKKLSRDEQLKMLSIAYRTAYADGVLAPEEHQILSGFCEEFVIGEGELRNYF